MTGFWRTVGAGLALGLFTTSCGGGPPPEAAVPTSVPKPDVPAAESEAPQPEASELPVRVAPRPETYFVSESCLAGPGPTAEEALAQCRRRKRDGSRFERRNCTCDAKSVIEVSSDAPAAFYLGCCWGVGDTPQQARQECETRRTQGCEEESDIVHAVTGPYARRGPFREFEGPEHNYLITSRLQDASWVAEDGEGPCFPDGTLVELAEGPRPIEAVQPGDHVVTLREGERVLAPVLAIKVREAEMLRIFTFDDGTLRVTPNHPVWLEGDWQPASAVEPGDVLVGLEGPRVVREVDEEHARVTVRTLSVGSPDSFFAGGVWVHNY